MKLTVLANGQINVKGSKWFLYFGDRGFNGYGTNKNIYGISHCTVIYRSAKNGAAVSVSPPALYCLGDTDVAMLRTSFPLNLSEISHLKEVGML